MPGEYGFSKSFWKPFERLEAGQTEPKQAVFRELTGLQPVRKLKGKEEKWLPNVLINRKSDVVSVFTVSANAWLLLTAVMC